MTGWLLSAKIMKLKSTTATTIRKLEIKLNLKKNFKTFSYFTNYVHLGNKNENKSKNLCQHHFLFFFSLLIFTLNQFVNKNGENVRHVSHPVHMLNKKVSQFIQTRNASMLRNGLTLFHFTTYNHLRSKLKAVHFFLFSKFIFRCREKCLKSPLKHSKMNDTKKSGNII